MTPSKRRYDRRSASANIIKRVTRDVTRIQGGNKNGSTAQHAGDERQQNVKHHNIISVKGNREVVIRL